MKHTIRIESEHQDDKGTSIGYRTHLITLSNKSAHDIVVNHILNLEWLDDLGLSADDICMVVL